ncbi:MAG: LEA14-like dessication related protein [Planctomycetota bacterium]|jgi:LEA14-like dessication related protein
MLNIIRSLLLGVVALGLFAGCVTIPDDFKEPGVSIVSITPKKSHGVLPQFDIVLRVTNPNRVELDIKGLTYTVHLNGSQLVDGVANDLPIIPAYGEAEVSLSARADLFGGLSLLTGMLADPNEPIGYEFNAAIDVGTFYPTINFNKRGSLSPL